VFRTLSDPPSSWESSLPPELLRLPPELARVDALLDDPAFFAPFAPYFHPVLGPPSTPVECYLRLMFLKFRYRTVQLPHCSELRRHRTRAAVPDPVPTRRAAGHRAAASRGGRRRGAEILRGRARGQPAPRRQTAVRPIEVFSVTFS